MISILKKIYRHFVPRGYYILDLDAVAKYREFDKYTLDEEVFPETSVLISAKLPSEPPEGITYTFGASGYMGDPSSNFCVIPTTWKNVNNYCHWMFTELPYLMLAFESKAAIIVLPAAIKNAKLPFQKRWLQVLKLKYPEKKVVELLKVAYPENALIPVNHCTSTSEDAIGKSMYKYYHHSRATPYLIQNINSYLPFFNQKEGKEYLHNKIYINRKDRTLKNEKELHVLLKSAGFAILNLEEYSIDEQVHYFLNAEMVVGFHGAGLANLLFSKTSVKVIEIVDQDCVYPCYLDGYILPGKKATRTYFHMLCEMKGINYSAIESKDYVLDLKNFQKLL
jgi:capsular polysaccharide biosynthesis protein